MTTDAMPPGWPFSESYPAARRRFEDAVAVAGGSLDRYTLGGFTDEDGGGLSCDVARIGPSDARRALVLVSGTHGLEGFAGSAVQSAFIEGGLGVRPDPAQAVILVHALNPYGFAHRHRVNEDNIDINRNFVAHDVPPANPNYARLHDDLVPAAWSGPEREKADSRIFELLEQEGMPFVQEAISRGQYEFKDGLFYGGTEPCWSNRTWREIVRSHLHEFDRVAYIDLHSGLGEWGEGEPIFRGGRDEQARKRAAQWYGEALTASEDGSSSSTPIVGNTASALAEELPAETILTAITLEFGTLPPIAVLQALRGDNWLQLHPEAAEAAVAEIDEAMREAFAPCDDKWRDAVLRTAEVYLAKAIAGLRGSS